MSGPLSVSDDLVVDLEPALPEIDTTVPNAARIYDYVLGGSHNFAADREMAERIKAQMPGVVTLARANRHFIRRAILYCQSQGIDQFLDLGSGIPTAGSVHEIARRSDPGARVAYVDNEPVAMISARSVLNGDALATVTDADLRDPDAVLTAPGVRDLLDLTRPVAVLAVAVLHFVPDAERPADVLARYRDRIAPGSFQVISHGTADFEPENMAAVARTYEATTTPIFLRARAGVPALLDGLDLVDPGVVETSTWRPEPDEPALGVSGYAAVGRVRGR